MDTHPFTDNLVETGSIPDRWKSNLVYTGDNLVYPVEMFIALMENKLKRSPDTIDATKEVLSYIPTINTTSNQNNHETCTTAMIWKHKHSYRLSKLQWTSLKQELLSEFGQHKRYSMKEKLKFLYSSKIGYQEDTENYLIRINMIVSYIEHGKISHVPPNSVWVQLLYMVGLSSQHSLFSSNDSYDQYHNDPVAITFLDNCFLDDFQDDETIKENIENTSHQNENKREILQQVNSNDEMSCKERKSKDSCFEPIISRTEEESRSDLEGIGQRENIHTSLNMIEQKEGENLTSDLRGKVFQENICSINECKNEGESLSKGKHATKEVSPCKICGVNYTLKCQEERHRLSKHGLEEFCDICLISFNNIRECKDHQIESHHYGTNCEICDLSFDTLEDLNKHQVEEHEGKQYKCKLCGSEMMYQSVNLHVNTVHYDERTFEVKKAKTKRKWDISRFNQDTEIKDYPLLKDLTYSPLKCTIPDGLTPVKRKTRKLLHFCGICKKNMKSVKELRAHCNNEHEGKRLKCNNCNFTSKAPHELARHLLRAHHMETEGYEVFRCTYAGCEYKCIEKHKFQTHIDGVHKGLRTFKCNACDKSFSQKGTLKLHVQGVHMGLRYVSN